MASEGRSEANTISLSFSLSQTAGTPLESQPPYRTSPVPRCPVVAHRRVEVSIAPLVACRRLSSSPTPAPNGLLPALSAVTTHPPQ
ncbi:hypothetical protein COCNU_03G000150 [Cocos nucifera]|uniref:Uncharacterized protein n=1 Tax=Cocos nucifera TaxID=13894 RepID=A0A8K0MYE8_COCNU|nr:hypothetical protein COCNU_03G000150 [Cocos nucifera]